MKRPFIRFLNVSLSGLILAGCSGGLHKELPDIYIPCEWESSSETTLFALDNYLWWEALGDPVLNSLIEKADAQNLDLSIASTRIEEVAYAGQAQVEIAQENLCNTWVTLSAEVASNYIEMRGAQRRLGVLEKNYEAQKDSVHLISELIKIGRSSTIDLQQAEAHLNGIAAQKPLLELTIEKAIHHLSILLGRAPEELVCELSVPKTFPKLPSDIPIGSPEELVKRRPDIRKKEKELALAQQGCNPHQLERAYYEYKKLILESLEEVENARAALHNERERNRILALIKESDHQAYHLVFELYQKGFKDYLEVQVMNRSLLEADDNFIQSEVQLLLHYISLYKALGGSWEDC